MHLNDARDIRASSCAAKQGVDYLPWNDVFPVEYTYSNYFGVWTEEIAAKFAFVSPSPPSDLAGNGFLIDGKPAAYDLSDDPVVQRRDMVMDSRGSLTDPEWEVISDCLDEPNAAQFDLIAAIGDGPWLREFGDVEIGFMQSPEAQEVETDYEDCLAGRGLEPHPGPETPGLVKGTDWNSINAEQIELALEVVACKDEVDYVQRLADALAAKQAPIIEEYASELVAHGQKLDDLLAEADEVVAEYKATQY